jgi:hypothetical protein
MQGGCKPTRDVSLSLSAISERTGKASSFVSPVRPPLPAQLPLIPDLAPLRCRGLSARHRVGQTTTHLSVFAAELIPPGHVAIGQPDCPPETCNGAGKLREAENICPASEINFGAAVSEAPFRGRKTPRGKTGRGDGHRSAAVAFRFPATRGDKSDEV